MPTLIFGVGFQRDLKDLPKLFVLYWELPLRRLGLARASAGIVEVNEVGWEFRRV